MHLTREGSKGYTYLSYARLNRRNFTKTFVCFRPISIHVGDCWKIVCKMSFCKFWTLFNICICYIYLYFLVALRSPRRELRNELKYVQIGIEMNEISCLKVRHKIWKTKTIPHRLEEEVETSL